LRNFQLALKRSQQTRPKIATEGVIPNFSTYHESVTSELDAVKNRIRNLVTHWLTDGEWKEAALRTVLRRHLPSEAVVGRGFIVGQHKSSTQIDLFVLRPAKPTIFRDGDLAIVTPDVPGAIAEVKTKINGPVSWKEIGLKLAEQGRFCAGVSKNTPWLGIFSYEGETSQAEQILDALCCVHKETGVAINCVTCGYDLFVRYWPPGEYEPGDDPSVHSRRKYWRAYKLPKLSPSYFIGNLVDAICNVDRIETDYAWFAFQGGKRPHMIAEKRVRDC
jgi:hypothetical protein